MILFIDFNNILNCRF